MISGDQTKPLAKLVTNDLPNSNRLTPRNIDAEQALLGAILANNQAIEKVEDFLPAKVIDCADDCAKDLTGKTVVIHAFGREQVTIKGKSYTFVGENHLICVN